MHVIDAVLESFSNLFRSHRYPPLEKLYSVFLFAAGLSLRDLSERLCLTGASRESVRIWVHRFSSLFKPSKRARRLVAVDETVLKVKGQICYLWAAIDVDTNEILAVYASKGRGIPGAVKFLRKVLDSCEGKPVIVVDRGPWYRWALERLGITYFQETFGKRNRIERLFREMKNRTKRFYNNINAKKLKMSCGLILGSFASLRYLLAIPLTFSALISDSLYPSPQGLLPRFHYSPMMSYWKRVDERLIKRGMLIMDLDFLRNYQDELIRMNRKKRGRPYRIAESYVMFLAVIRHLFSLSYRQLEGFTRSLERVFPILSAIDYSWIRRRIVRLGGDLVSYNLRSVKGPVVIVLDSTGVKVFRSGSWLERGYSRRRGYLKIHFAIDARTGEIVCFERTTDRVHDSEVAKRMVDRSMEAGNVITVIGDGACDSIGIGFIRYLEMKGIEPIIRPRRDAIMIRYYGYRIWSKIVGYGRRWMAETAISRFKALFGEHLLSRKPRWMDAELTIKAFIYNMILRAITT